MSPLKLLSWLYSWAMSILKVFFAERPRGAEEGELRLLFVLPFSAVVELVTFEFEVNDDTEAGEGDDDPLGEVDDAGTLVLSLSLPPMLSTLCGGDDSRWRRCARRSKTSALLPVLLSTFIFDCLWLSKRRYEQLMRIVLRNCPVDY